MNNSIVSIQGGETRTTSLIVAEGVEYAHASVIKLIRQNISDLEEFGPLRFEIQVGREDGKGGQKREYAILNERQATLLMTYMRNNDIVRAYKKRLVKAFYELAKPQEQLSKKDLALMVIQSEEEKEALVHQVEELKPKADFHDQVAKSEDDLTVAEAAKLLGTGQNRLYAFLRQIRWVRRNNEPYQDRIEAGYLDVELQQWTHPQDGIQERFKAVVKGKGLVKLRELMAVKKSA